MGEETFHSRKQQRVLPWVMCGLGASFYFYEYLLRVSPSVMTSSLMHAYHLSAASFGNLTAFYYYIYAPMQIPVGLLMDRYGPRRLLTLAALSCALGTYFFVSSHYLFVAEFGRFLVGFGSAFAFVGVLKLATVWLPPERFAMVSGLTMALGTVAGVVGDLSLTVLVQHEGWKFTSFMAACIGAVIALLLFLVIRDGARTSVSKEEGSVVHSFASILKGLVVLLRNPQIWVNGCIGCLLYIPTDSFAELWGIPYFQAAYHYTNTQAAGAVSMIFMGWAVGGPIVGLLSDHIGQRRLPMTIGSVVAAILLSVVFYVPHISQFGVYSLLFVFGAFSSAQVIVFAVGREISAVKSAGTAIALTNMFVMLGGVLFQPLIGVLLDHISDSRVIIDGVRMFSASDYQAALSVLPIGLILCVLATFFLRETYCRLVKDDVGRVRAI